MRETGEPSFNVKAFLDEHWPDPAVLLRFLRSYNCGVQLQAIQKWALRESMPSQWFALLLALMEVETGKPVSLVKYIRQ